MPADRLVFFLVAAPVLLVAAFFLVATPWYAAASLLAAKSTRVRAHAGWLLLAWAVLVAVFALYFMSGWWYRENTAIKPVAPAEYLELAGCVIFGVLLPGLAWRRLLAARSQEP